jgi:hypothetical protein
VSENKQFINEPNVKIDKSISKRERWSSKELFTKSKAEAYGFHI